MQPIRISRAIAFAAPLDPDGEAVLRGIEVELRWRGGHTVSLTPAGYVFRGPGFGHAIAPLGGSTTWLVRGGDVAFAGPSVLQVRLDLDPVALFLVPLVAAAALVLLPLGPAARAIGLAAGAALWYHAYVSAWKRYRTWIWAGAQQPWSAARLP